MMQRILLLEHDIDVSYYTVEGWCVELGKKVSAWVYACQRSEEERLKGEYGEDVEPVIALHPETPVKNRVEERVRIYRVPPEPKEKKGEEVDSDG